MFWPIVNNDEIKNAVQILFHIMLACPLAKWLEGELLAFIVLVLKKFSEPES